MLPSCRWYVEIGQNKMIQGLTDEPAGPPRFIKCLRDIWTPLGETMTFEVEVAGCPLPELNWFHNDRKVKEGKDIQVS